MTESRRKFFYVFEAGEVESWKYCPVCGEELLEIYPGDYFGHITCMGDYCVEGIDFKIKWEDDK